METDELTQSIGVMIEDINLIAGMVSEIQAVYVTGNYFDQHTQEVHNRLDTIEASIQHLRTAGVLSTLGGRTTALNVRAVHYLMQLLEHLASFERIINGQNNTIQRLEQRLRTVEGNPLRVLPRQRDGPPLNPDNQETHATHGNGSNPDTDFNKHGNQDHFSIFSISLQECGIDTLPAL